MKKFIAAVLAISMLLVGCGQFEHTTSATVSNYTNSATIIGGSAAPTTKNNPSHAEWVLDVYGPNTTYYKLSSTKTSKVGKMLYDFQVKHPINFGPSGWETNSKGAIQVYSMPGIDTKKAVAVKLKNGTYVEANAIGSKQP